MTMQLRSGRRQRSYGARIRIGLGVIVLLLVFLFHQQIGSLLGSVSLFVSPTQSDLYENLPKAVLAARLAESEEALSRVRYQSILYSLAVEENTKLLQSLGLPEQAIFARGRILARPPRTHYDTLLVGLESQTELESGDQAHIGGVLVGEVHEQRGETAVIQLFSSPGTALDAHVGDPTAIVVLYGLGAGGFVFEVSKEVAIEKGSPVFAAGGDALIGVVESIVDEPDRTDYRVYAASPIQLSDARAVEFTKKVTVLEEI